MKTFSCLLLMAALAVGSLGACTPVTKPASETGLNVSWEYTFVTVRQANEQYVQSRLNELGQDGWECFFVDKSATGITYLLKRPEPE